MALKISKGGSIRKVGHLPSSFQELQQILAGVYGESEFHLEYSGEGISLEIKNDQDLAKVYELSAGKPSVKIQVVEPGTQSLEVLSAIDTMKEKLASEHALSYPRAPVKSISNITDPILRKKCRDCKEVVSGKQYQCLYCGFVLCQTCETKSSHLHPFVQFQSHSFIEKLYHVQFRVLQSCELVNGPANLEVKLKNVGQFKWPLGTKLVLTEGDVNSDYAELPKIYCGQSHTVNIEIRPISEGTTSLVFRIKVCDIVFGKLKLDVTYINLPNEKFSKLRAFVNFGVPLQQAQEFLNASGWILPRALANL